MDDGAVAEAAHVTPAWLSAVKNDRIKTPPLDKLRAIATVCRVPLRFLTEPMGVVPVEEEHPADAFVVGGRNMSSLTEADREVVLQVAERLREIAERSSKS